MKSLGLVLKMISSKIWVVIILTIAGDSNGVSDNQSQSTPTFDWIKGHLTDECSRRLSGLPFDKTEDARRALDAYGMPEAGLLVNNREWLGHFSECSHLQDFKYCLLTVNVTAVSTVLKTLVLAVNPVRRGREFNSTVKPNDYIFEHPNEQIYLVNWGVCVPQQCTYEDLNDNIPSLLDISAYKLHGFHVNDIYEDIWCLEDPVIPYSLGFYITVIFFVTVGILMIVGSIFDVIERNFKAEDQERGESMEIIPLIEDESNENQVDSLEHSDHGYKGLLRRIATIARTILLDFALNRNLKKLLQTGKGGDSKIRCLHGIRVISMLWVMLGHVILDPFMQRLVNQFEFAEWKMNFFFQTLILNFFYSVDSFFFLSGLLVCFTTLNKLEATRDRYPWHWFYLHRYIRLSPLMLVTLMIQMFIRPYCIRGPNAAMYGEKGNCSKYWWTNLIYINNIYPWHFSHECMPWTWYLANDMQFFIISPLIIVSLKRSYWLGFGIIGTMLAFSFGITGTIVAAYNFRSPTWDLMMNNAKYADIIYTMPYARIPPYLVGMALGYMLHKQRSRKDTISKPLFLVGWIIASAVALALLCGTITFKSSLDSASYRANPSFLANSVLKAVRQVSALGSVMYEVFSRFAWALFLSWVVIACQFGGPGWVNDILSWYFWEPLSRANYNAYLLHVIISFVFYGNFGLSFYASGVLMTFYYSGIVLISYICAMVLTLAVEIPISSMERRFMPRPS